MPADGSVPETRMGRPPKLHDDEETLKTIEGLARIQCTQREAAAVLRVHPDTFGDFLRSHEKARQAWEDGLQSGKASLRRNQWKMSESNPTMAIWLGKQWLDQTDKSDTTTTLDATDNFASLLTKVATKDVFPGDEREG